MRKTTNSLSLFLSLHHGVVSLYKIVFVHKTVFALRLLLLFLPLSRHPDFGPCLELTMRSQLIVQSSGKPNVL